MRRERTTQTIPERKRKREILRESKTESFLEVEIVREIEIEREKKIVEESRR
jgi:hypothetical protein